MYNIKFLLKIITTLVFLFITSFSFSDNQTFENFESYQKKSIFSNWKMRKGSPQKASRVYKIINKKNNKYLNASTFGNHKISIQLARKTNWNIWKKPFLSWKWRILKLPSGANESISKKNDSAASIYVVFQRKKIPFASWKYQPVDIIKYCWSSSLPKGKIIYKKPRSKMGVTYYNGRFIILQTGHKKKGSWITEKRNVLADYKKVFGRSPKYNPILIGILTDSNATKSSASADYDNIVISDK